MKLIKVDEAVLGQKVAKDVTDLKGVLLFKSGITLDEKTPQRIKGRNITHIYVETDEAGGGGNYAFATPEAVDQELDRVFADTISMPVMAELCEAAKRYLKSQIK